MQHSYSETELIRYIFNELEPVDATNLELILAEDYELQEKFRLLQKTLLLLEDCLEKPDPSTIDMIMEYSRSKSIKKATSQV